METPNPARTPKHTEVGEGRAGGESAIDATGKGVSEAMGEGAAEAAREESAEAAEEGAAEAAGEGAAGAAREGAAEAAGEGAAGAAWEGAAEAAGEGAAGAAWEGAGEAAEKRAAGAAEDGTGVEGGAAETTASEAAGRAAGEAVETATGETAGTASGEAAGTAAGGAAGTAACGAAGTTAGEAAGLAAGEAAGTTAGENAETAAGGATGTTAGEAAGIAAGEAAEEGAADAAKEGEDVAENGTGVAGGSAAGGSAAEGGTAGATTALTAAGEDAVEAAVGAGTVKAKKVGDGVAPVGAMTRPVWAIEAIAGAGEASAGAAEAPAGVTVAPAGAAEDQAGAAEAPEGAAEAPTGAAEATSGAASVGMGAASEVPAVGPGAVGQGTVRTGEKGTGRPKGEVEEVIMTLSGGDRTGDLMLIDGPLAHYLTFTDGDDGDPSVPHDEVSPTPPLPNPMLAGGPREEPEETTRTRVSEGAPIHLYPSAHPPAGTSPPRPHPGRHSHVIGGPAKARAFLGEPCSPTPDTQPLPPPIPAPLAVPQGSRGDGGGNRTGSSPSTNAVTQTSLSPPQAQRPNGSITPALRSPPTNSLFGPLPHEGPHWPAIAPPAQPTRPAPTEGDAMEREEMQMEPPLPGQPPTLPPLTPTAPQPPLPTPAGMDNENQDVREAALDQIFLPICLAGFGIRRMVRIAPQSFASGEPEMIDRALQTALEGLPLDVLSLLPSWPSCASASPDSLFAEANRLLGAHALEAVRARHTSPLHLARLTSLHGVGAGAWLQTVPYADPLRIPEAQWQVDSSSRLGLPIPQLALACQCSCGQAIDEMTVPHHAVWCPRFGVATTIHDTVKFLLRDFAVEAGFAVKMEDSTLQASIAGISRRTLTDVARARLQGELVVGEGTRAGGLLEQRGEA
ncbi:unnamed protein product [Closterium sp. NIES-54]